VKAFSEKSVLHLLKHDFPTQFPRISLTIFKGKIKCYSSLIYIKSGNMVWKLRKNRENYHRALQKMCSKLSKKNEGILMIFVYAKRYSCWQQALLCKDYLSVTHTSFCPENFKNICLVCLSPGRLAKANLELKRCTYAHIILILTLQRLECKSFPLSQKVMA